MTNNNIIWVVVVILVVAGGIYLFSQNQPAPAEEPTTSGSGRVVVGITDAAADMGSVSSVKITVDKMELHSAASSWTTVSTESREYDLLALKQSGEVSLYADATVPAGTYDQARLTISNVVVVANGETKTARLPSGILHVVGRTVVDSESTAAITFDFIADKSLHVTGSGEFVFAPVIKFTSESSATVQINAGVLSITNRGRVEEDISVGMNEKGETKSNFELKGDVRIGVDGRISL